MTAIKAATIANTSAGSRGSGSKINESFIFHWDSIDSNKSKAILNQLHTLAYTCKMKQPLFLLFFSLTLASVAQSVAIDREGIIKTVISKALNQVYVLYENRIVTIDLVSMTSKDTVFHDNGIALALLSCISTSNENYFLSPSGGSVFLLKSNSLTRIDNSFEHQMQTGAGIFVYKNNIYKYGGYGLWSDRNFITRFDFTTDEWELVSFRNSEIIPVGRRSSIVKVIGDNLYVIGGVQVNEFDPLVNVNSNEVWKFDLVNGLWTLIGEIKDFSEQLVQHPLIDFNEKIIVNNLHDDVLHEIDIIKNKITTYRRTSFSRKLNQGTSPETNMFYYRNQFYGFLPGVNSPNKMILSKRNTDEIFGELISEEAFYENETRLAMMVPTFALLLLLIPLGLVVKKRKSQRDRLVLMKGQVYFNHKIIALDPLNLTVLTYLLNSKEQVYAKDIIALIDKPHLDYSHSTRILNDVLYKTNYVIRTSLKTENDIIQISKSTFDKRLKVYSVDKDMFFNG